MDMYNDDLFFSPYHILDDSAYVNPLGENMKKLFLSLITVFLLIPSLLFATPYLACDPSDADIVQVEVEITYWAPGQAPVVTTEPGIYEVVGSDVRVLDLAGRSGGDYSFRVRWKDASGWWSDWSTFDAKNPGKSQNWRIVE